MLSFLYQSLFRSSYRLAAATFTDRKSLSTRLLYTLDWLLCLYGLRFYSLSLILYNGTTLSYYACARDPFCTFSLHTAAYYDPFLYAAMGLMACFSLFCQTKLYTLQIETQTWKWWRELLVDLQDAYTDSVYSTGEQAKMRRKKERKIAEKLANIKAVLGEKAIARFSTVLAKLEMTLKLEYFDKRKFFNHKLAAFPDLSAKVRLRVLVVSLCGDKGCGFVFIATCK